MKNIICAVFTFYIASDSIHFVKSDDNRLTGDCELSLTTVNKERVCRNKIIFQDDFKDYKPYTWTKETYIPYPFTPSSDILFNYYDEDNVHYDGDNVVFIPQILNDSFVRSGHLNLEWKCTIAKEELCSKQARSYSILPPISTGRISTRRSFSFKYGIIEITAKVPQGDWLIPEMVLEPKDQKYGQGLESGRIVIALVRGNKDSWSNGTYIGYKRVSSSLLMSTPSGKIRSRAITAQSEEPWHFHYNKYTFTWKPDGYSFSINGRLIGNFLDRNFSGTLAGQVGFKASEESHWYTGSALAPFDQEFYICLGLSVGGREFPDGSVSGDYIKPWKQRSVKQTVDFWLAKEKWEKSWEEVKTNFKITKIKVTSL